MDLLSSDVDDVLYHFVPGLFDWRNKAYPEHRVSHKGLKQYDFSEHAHAFGHTREQKAQKIQEFYRSEEFRQLELVERAVKGIIKLSERYKLMSVTSRSENIRPLTVDSLRRDFGDVFERVVFVDSHDKQKRGKGEVCREHGAIAHIDDLIPHLVDCAAHGIAGILLDRSWNQGEVPKRVIRVYDWDEIPDAVEFIKNRYAA